VTRREIPLDASAILATLAAHKVDYLVIGGLAVQAHGHPRTTQDLDLVPEPSSRNLRRLHAALTELGARSVGGAEPTTPRLPAAGVVELDTDAGGVDVHIRPPGAAPYDQLAGRALQLDLDPPVRVVGLEDLIAMKRASGRPIDRGDIAALTEPA
jgi:hypothetical protein